MDAENGGGQRGEPDAGDTLTFTYGGAVNPDLILSGWNGSATAVTVRIDDNSGDEVLTVRNASSGSVLIGLGLVELKGDYTGSTVSYTGSMTLTGSTVTIVLGSRSGSSNRDTSAKTMVWWTLDGSVDESGHPDSNF